VRRNREAKIRIARTCSEHISNLTLEASRELLLKYVIPLIRLDAITRRGKGQAIRRVRMSRGELERLDPAHLSRSYNHHQRAMMPRAVFGVLRLSGGIRQRTGTVDLAFGDPLASTGLASRAHWLEASAG